MIKNNNLSLLIGRIPIREMKMAIKGAVKRDDTALAKILLSECAKFDLNETIYNDILIKIKEIENDTKNN
jgi:hypothetical protein